MTNALLRDQSLLKITSYLHLMGTRCGFVTAFNSPDKDY
jgi:hypothetical protein